MLTFLNWSELTATKSIYTSKAKQIKQINITVKYPVNLYLCHKKILCLQIKLFSQKI